MRRFLLIVLSSSIMLSATVVPAAAQGRSDFKFTATAVTFPVDKKVELRLRGTTRYRQTEGKAIIEYKDGNARLTLNVREVDPPSERQYTTYVFWAVTPEGFVDNIGELRPRKRGIIRKTWGGTVETSTRHRTFCIVMTAEPHFLVESPSREVVLASLPPDEREGYETEPVEVHFRGDIGLESVPWQEDRVSTQRDRETPVELFEARRAIDIARYFQVDVYASKEFKQAESWLADAEMAFERSADERAAIWARRAVVMAEVARRLARERREAEDQRRKEALIADLEDRANQAEKELGRARTDIVQLNRALDQKDLELREANQQIARLATELRQAHVAIEQRDEQIRQLTETEQALREQLNTSAEQARIQALETEIYRLRQTSIPLTEHRGKLALARLGEIREDGDQFIVVLPNDQLFVASPRSTAGVPRLKPEAAAKLDRIAGILTTYPMGTYSVEGHLAGPGAPERLQALSQANAAAVVAHLLARGVPSEALRAVGRGAEAPLLPGQSAQAQRRNQRVEIVIRRA